MSLPVAAKADLPMMPGGCAATGRCAPGAAAGTAEQASSRRRGLGRRRTCSGSGGSSPAGLQVALPGLSTHGRLGCVQERRFPRALPSGHGVPRGQARGSQPGRGNGTRGPSAPWQKGGQCGSATAKLWPERFHGSPRPPPWGQPGLPGQPSSAWAGCGSWGCRGRAPQQSPHLASLGTHQDFLPGGSELWEQGPLTAVALAVAF